MSRIGHRIRNSGVLALVMKYFARAHIWVYQRTNGRLGARLGWLPAALITTTGRRSGQLRTTATLCLRDGEKIVLPASFAGRDHDPAWYLNIQAHPRVHVQYRSERWEMTARDATAPERRRYWAALTKLYPPYRGYRDATDRVVPLVVCER